MHFFDQLDLVKAKVSTVAIAIQAVADEYEIPALADCAKTLLMAKDELIELKAQEGVSATPVDLQKTTSQQSP
jgi:hypothetical protein